MFMYLYHYLNKILKDLVIYIYKEFPRKIDSLLLYYLIQTFNYYQSILYKDNMSLYIIMTTTIQYLYYGCTAVTGQKTLFSVQNHYFFFIKTFFFFLHRVFVGGLINGKFV